MSHGNDAADTPKLPERLCCTHRLPLLILGAWMAICGGTLYGFSAFEVELMSQCALSAQQLDMVYAAGQLGVGLGITSGIIYDRIGPGAVCCWALVLLLLGNFGLSMSLEADDCGGEATLVMLYFVLQHGSTGLYQAGLFSNIRMTPASSQGAVAGAVAAGYGLSAAFWTTAYKHAFGRNLARFFKGTGVIFGATALIGLFAIPFLFRSAGPALAYGRLEEETEVRTKASPVASEDSVTQIIGKPSADSTVAKKTRRSLPPRLLPAKDTQSLRDIVCQPEFWLFVGAFSLLQAVGSGVFIANLSLMAQSLGIPEETRLSYVRTVSYCNCGGRLLAGYIMDVCEARGIPRGVHPVWTGSILACVAASMWLLPEHVIPGLILPALIAVGVAYGANWAILPSFVSSRFGTTNVGVCFNLNTSLMSCMVFMASVTAGSLYDAEAKVTQQPPSRAATTGSFCAGVRCWRGAYFLGFCLSCAGLTCAGALAWRLRCPRGTLKGDSPDQQGET